MDPHYERTYPQLFNSKIVDKPQCNWDATNDTCAQTHRTPHNYTESMCAFTANRDHQKIFSFCLYSYLPFLAGFGWMPDSDLFVSLHAHNVFDFWRRRRKKHCIADPRTTAQYRMTNSNRIPIRQSATRRENKTNTINIQNNLNLFKTHRIRYYTQTHAVACAHTSLGNIFVVHRQSLRLY